MTRTSTMPTRVREGGRSSFRLRGRHQVLLWSTGCGIGIVCVLLAALGVRDVLLGGIGAVALTTTYVYGLAARTGGRPFICAALALVLGIAVFVVDNNEMRTGAAVMMAAVSAVFAVMGTTPAVTFPRAARECVVAAIIAGLGSLAAIGYAPAVTVNRFQYTVLVLALIGIFLLVYRLGAGLHGLGRRGFATVSAGGILLLATLLYAEAIRRYGTPGLVGTLRDGVVWMREHLGGYPRPIEALLGIPALAWGTHMRARRRQGWWVCAFGVAATAPMATTFVNPEVSVVEGVLSICYSLVVGLALGYVVIGADLFLTGGPGRSVRGGRAGRAGRAGTSGRGAGTRSTGGRRAAREAEEAAAVRPEPRRTRALL
ncbi:hypothetical protein P5P86_01045 [Nocardioides sp. BP30]|uniref:hypothetical protein n=1 Tax=Nocardioides sp. BP30 TaxID=3036374 RepID=UPI0024694A64|nr:hypothetical protein [Nocardioides sp. BP30]WGL52426.1 hypothetical protein P5P86_01045 [Nocardioides sp. BP30]